MGPAVKVGGARPAPWSSRARQASRPRSLVVISEKALEGLPAGHAGAHDSFLTELPMPARRPKTGYDHATLDWNPSGHAPAGIYTPPHFDVHFYMIDRPHPRRHTFKGDAAAQAAKRRPPTCCPAGYVAPRTPPSRRWASTPFNRRGLEFKASPSPPPHLRFSQGRGYVFVEPMVTKAFLETRPDVTLDVRTPKAYSRPGWYPSRYRVAYDAKAKSYVVAMTALKPWRMEGAPMAAR